MIYAQRIPTCTTTRACVWEVAVMRHSLGRVNDHSVYRDLIAAQKAAHIPRVSAASEEPGANVLTPQNAAFLSPLSSSFLSSNSYPSSPPFSRQIYLFAPPPRSLPPSLLFLHVLWFPWELNCLKPHTHTHTHKLKYTCTHNCAPPCTRLFHADYLGMSTSGSNDSNICLFCAPHLPACGNRNFWNQINYLCQFPQGEQNTQLITNLYRRLVFPSDLKQHLSVSAAYVCEHSFSASFPLNHKSILHTGSACWSVFIFLLSSLTQTQKRILKHLPSRPSCFHNNTLSHCPLRTSSNCV